MEENFFKISMTKVLDLLLSEERLKIRKYYLDTLGKATSDLMDSSVPTESETMKLFTVN